MTPWNSQISFNSAHGLTSEYPLKSIKCVMNHLKYAKNGYLLELKSIIQFPLGLLSNNAMFDRVLI